MPGRVQIDLRAKALTNRPRLVLATRWPGPMVEINCTAIVGGIKEELTSSWRRNGRGRKRAGREQSRSSQEKNNLLNYKANTPRVSLLSLSFSLFLSIRRHLGHLLYHKGPKKEKETALTASLNSKFCRQFLFISTEFWLKSTRISFFLSFYLTH